MNEIWSCARGLQGDHGLEFDQDSSITTEARGSLTIVVTSNHALVSHPPQPVYVDHPLGMSVAPIVVLSLDLPTPPHFPSERSVNWC